MQRLMLKIVSVNFERDLKWRFDDGEIKFYAVVKDETFLKAVESGNISFVFGDKIFAEVETIQQIVDGEPRKVIRSIVKVLEYGKNQDFSTFALLSMILSGSFVPAALTYVALHEKTPHERELIFLVESVKHFSLIFFQFLLELFVQSMQEVYVVRRPSLG